MAIALRYAEAQLQPRPQPQRAKVGAVTGVALFAAAVFGLTLALLTLV